MRTEGIILSVLLLLTGCSLEQVGDAFELSMPEYDTKWNPELVWVMADIQVYTNIEIEEAIARNNIPTDKRYQNGPCLAAAERKYELALQYGYPEKDLEIVVIKLTKDAAIKADWSNGWPTHAMLRYKNTIYDNGFIGKIPFDVQELSRYGEVIPDQWSNYRRTK